MSRGKKVLFYGFFVGILWFISIQYARAWFGAGVASLPTTSQGLNGEIIDPQYRPTPATYTPGTKVTVTARISNPSTQPHTLNAFFRVYKILKAPITTDISDGQPSSAGLDEKSLFAYFSDSQNNELTLQSITPLSPVTLPAGTQITVSGNFTTDEAGYYQFMFTSADADVEANSGLILATGFVRVLATATPQAGSSTQAESGVANATVSTTALPTATVKPTTTAAPHTITNDGKTSFLGIAAPSCTDQRAHVTMRVLQAGSAQPGITVSFTQQDQTLTSVTNEVGEASVDLPATASGEVHAIPDFGYPAQSGVITPATDCPTETSEDLMNAGDGIRAGKVLGISTTNSMSRDTLFAYGIFASLTMIAIGIFTCGVLVMR